MDTGGRGVGWIYDKLAGDHAVRIVTMASI